MEPAVVGHLGEADIVVPVREADISDIDQRFKLRRVGIAPELIVRRAIPRNIAGHLYAVCHLVIGKALTIRIVI